MIPKRDLDISQLEYLFTREICHWQSDSILLESYREQRRQFIIKRLRLQTKIMLLVGLTLSSFFMWVNQQPNGKIYAFKIGLILESFILICWFL